MFATSSADCHGSNLFFAIASDSAMRMAILRVRGVAVSFRACSQAQIRSTGKNRSPSERMSVGIYRLLHKPAVSVGVFQAFWKNFSKFTPDSGSGACGLGFRETLPNSAWCSLFSRRGSLSISLAIWITFSQWCAENSSRFHIALWI